ncbi:hypothetical protein CCR75_003365 [Bremia lactucae]|uniref:Ubiquitin family protein n=1 Tax=Bremia lactucae TaxID=4779 RepID=A0A976FI47_BRELC|nr:hypothetical protein CCR75_003365 [Bremia lactucae]
MVNLHVKTTAGKKFSVDVALESSVLECKEALVTPTEVAVALQRLIYKGKVLKDDQPLASYGEEATICLLYASAQSHIVYYVAGIAEDDTIYFVKGSVRPAAATPTTSSAGVAQARASATTAVPDATPAAAVNPFSNPLSSGGGPSAASNPNWFGNLMGSGNPANMQQMQQQMQQQMMENPEMMRQMMDSPMMQNLLSNPEIMRSMMQSNPAMQQLMEQNPQLSHIMNDPELLRQGMEAMRNPAAMRELMRSQDTALRNIESHPEGFNALRRMYHDVQEPLMDAAASGTPAPRGPAFTMPGVAGGNSTASTTPSQPASVTNPVGSINPWATPAASTNTAANPWSAAGMNGLGDMGGLGNIGGNPEMMAQMMQSPLFQAALSQVSSNPTQFISQMEAMNPQMAAVMNANPQMRQMMSNPEFLRQAMNPNNLQAMMQMQNAMNQLRSSGLMPGLDTMNSGAVAGGADTTRASNPSTGNPFAMFGDFNGAGFNAAANTSVSNPAEVYASQLTQLSDMGFTNQEQNIRALQATMGNVQAAVDRLLSGTI